MPGTSTPGGFQPETRSAAARRADFDLMRRLKVLEAGGGGGGGGTDEVWVGPGTPPGAQELWYDTDEVAVMGGMPAVFSAVGIALTGTFNPAASTVCTLVVPARPVAGMCLVHSLTMFSRTTPTSTDLDEYSLLKDGTAIAYGRISGDGTYISGALSVATPLAANTSATFTVTLLRSSGTGNRQVFADGRNNRLDALWMAT